MCKTDQSTCLATLSDTTCGAEVPLRDPQRDYCEEKAVLIGNAICAPCPEGTFAHSETTYPPYPCNSCSTAGELGCADGEVAQGCTSRDDNACVAGGGGGGSATCGDGLVTVGFEECDDGRPPANNDGCSAECTVEPGWNCQPITLQQLQTLQGETIPVSTPCCRDGDTQCATTTPAPPSGAGALGPCLMNWAAGALLCIALLAIR